MLKVCKLSNADENVVLIVARCLPHIVPNVLLNKREVSNNNKQLLDEVEHGIVNYQNRGLCYLPKPKAEADNSDTRF